MKNIYQIGSALLLASCLAACSSITKQDVGMVTGGAVGALVGSQIGQGTGNTVAVAVGTLAGAVIGGAIGKSMDKTDQMEAQQALENAKTNQTKSWRNPDTGNTYRMTPTKTYKKPNGQYCREYTTKAMIGGKQEDMYGTACRQPDGSWKIIK